MSVSIIFFYEFVADVTVKRFEFILHKLVERIDILTTSQGN